MLAEAFESVGKKNGFVNGGLIFEGNELHGLAFFCHNFLAGDGPARHPDPASDVPGELPPEFKDIVRRLYRLPSRERTAVLQQITQLLDLLQDRAGTPA